MALYIVNYDLCQPGRNYNNLFAAIRSYGTWCNYLKSAWLIVTDKTAFQVAEHLRTSIDANDKLFVIRCNGDWAGASLTQEVLDWIRKQT